MKNKSSFHRLTNKFKFTPFAERVSGIDVRHTALYHIDHSNEAGPRDNETYFQCAVQKWKVLNLTTEYVSFSRKVEGIHTLPQLLHKKEQVVDLLLENIEARNVLTLQPLLELVVVLAKDLQEDFYEYFPRILKTLISLLNTKDTDQLEWTLVCLAFLFKFLRSYLKRDILVVFEAVLPLLSDTVPWYVKNFAAESFAFVARDIKDKKRFLKNLIKSVADVKDGTVGCGRLLFEIMRGVNKQFHSCTQGFLDLLLDFMLDKTINQQVYFDILTQTISDMLQVIQPNNANVFWTTILPFATKNITCLKTNEDSLVLESTLKLIGQVIQHEDGCFLTNPPAVLALVHQLLNSCELENVLDITSKISVLLLTSKTINMPHEDSVILVKKVLSISHTTIKIHFVEQVIMSASFDLIVLPNFISQIDGLDKQIIALLSKICVEKSPLSKNGIDLYSWVKYPIDFGSKTDSVCEMLVNNIDIDISKTEELENCICSLICLPHIKLLDATKVQSSLEKLLSDLINHLKDNHGNLERRDNQLLLNVMFVLCVALETVIHIVDINKLESWCVNNKLIEILLPYSTRPEFICSLRCLDLYLTACHRQKNLDISIFNVLYSAIDGNLKSPFHEVRLLTTHIFSLFEEKIQKLSNKKKSDSSKEKLEIFSLCFSIESTQPSLQEYRDQLMTFSKLAFRTTQHQLTSDTEHETYPLKYALGFLNVNFKLLWDPLKTFITSFANGMSAAKFWEVFHPCLKEATTHARQNISLPDYKELFNGSLEFLNNIFVSFFELNDKLDFSLYRIHLWDILYDTPNLSETKNRDLTTLFMDFMNVEFEKSTQGNVYIEDSEEMDVTDEDMEETVDESITENVEKHDKDENEDMNKLTKSTYETFTAILKVYSKIQNPKAMYMESTLKNLYLEYLMHKNPIIQKIALDCLMKYRNKHLTPYKDNLYNLVDGIKFKDELRTFRIQVDEGSIKPEDREEVLPIILRITFSKMITNMGVDKKGGSQLRKSLVIRFLFGCEENELISFTNMAFNVFKIYLNLEISELPEIVSQTMDELVSIPPRKMLGALNLVDIMREQFTRPGQDKLMLHLLKIVLCIGCLINGILSQPKKLQTGYSKILKEIRSNCIISISRFFEQFEGYNWNFKENISLIYEVFVWNMVEKLPIEGIHSPTPILRLFSTWSQYPHYHPLLNVFMSNHKHTPLYYIMQLLNNNKISYSVNDVCLQIIERLLTTECNKERQMIEIPCEYTVPVQVNHIQQLELKEQLNYGSSILIPNIESIVDILRQKFNETNIKKIKRGELVILSRITELVYQTEDVDKLLSFSLPVLINRIGQNTSEDNLQSSITTLTILLSKSSNPKKYIRLLTPLFGQVIPAASRLLLCKSLDSLNHDNDVNMSASISIVKDINATDEKWIEQPDFEKRIGAFKRVYELLDKQQLKADLAALIFHNCFFTVRHNNDLSLRNMATSCMQKIAPKLVVQYKDTPDKDYLIKDTILHLIKKSFKINNDVLHMEGIALLGELVRECSNMSGVFNELHPLTNKIDKEIDFFENLQHLQVHRRIRAFQRFCTFAKESKIKPGNKTLTDIIIPLTSHYICSEKHVSKHALVDAAIDTIGTVCSLLPWRQYEAILKYYVEKLLKSTEYQKQLIKIVCVILDAFHFDLSKVSSNADVTNDVPVIDKEMTEVKDEELVIPDEDAEDVIEEQSNKSTFGRVLTLSPSNAKRAISIIRYVLIKLKWSSSQIMEHEQHHKMAKSGDRNREQEEIIRLPMALAVVKLLQKLPEQMLENSIQSIFIKVANFLKSPLISIRTEARDILSKITLAVGTTHLGTLLELLSALLTRGIHVHVLISTVHTVLTAVKDSFSVGEIDKHVYHILKVCTNDLFGKASEEKEVAKLGHKAPEAKPSLKSYSTLRIVAQNICESSMIELVKPFKDIAETTHSKKTILKVQTALQNICLGLGVNENISLMRLLQFINEVLSGTVDKLMSTGQKRKSKNDEREERYKSLKPDCFIINPDPKRKKSAFNKNIRNSIQANSHVILEFGLTLFHTLLQKDNINEDVYQKTVNECCPYVIDSIKSTQVKLATVAMKCMTTIFSKRIQPPIVKYQIENISASVFQILHKYSTTCLSKNDDNFHLVSNAFKVVTALVRDVKYHTINTDQLKALLLYAEHDINNHEKQATAFTLLKTIIGAKFDAKEIQGVVAKVADISILSENPRAREECRTVMVCYVMNYPLGKKLLHHIEFYLKQLSYEGEPGRVSAIRMLQTFIDKFTQDVLNEHASLMYVSLGSRLVNDTSVECKMLIAEVLELLLQKVSMAKRNELFKINITLLKSHKVAHVEMAAQLCSRFVNIENQMFKNRLESLLPELNTHLYEEDPNIGRCVKLPNTNNNNENNKNDQLKDNCFIQILLLINKICETCQFIFEDAKYYSITDEIAYNCQTLLGHSHSWVRLNAAKYFDMYLNAINNQQISNSKKDVGMRSFCSHTALKSLVLDLSSQLIPGGVSSDMADIVSTNLTSLIKLSTLLSHDGVEGEEDDGLSEFWIMRTIKSSINSEVTRTPGSIVIRKSVLGAFEKIISDFRPDTVLTITKLLLPSIIREINKSDNSESGVKELAVSVGQMMNQILGEEEYNGLLVKVQGKLNAKRKERKQKIAQDKINNPEKAAKRKDMLREKRKDYKRKKVDVLKGRMSKHRVKAR